MNALNAGSALQIITKLKADMAAGVIPATAKSLADLDAEHYLAGVADKATVARFVNVWLAAKR